MRVIATFAALLLAATPLLAPAAAGPRKIVEPLDPAIIANLQVVGVETSVSAPAQAGFDKLEKIAADKRAAAGLPAVTGDAVPGAPRPAREQYATLPFARMFPLVIEDITREWGLTSGRPVKLKVTVDTIKMADGGAMMLFGSADQLAGLVDVVDAETAAPLGSFYIDVVNSHGGLIGALERGTGVRETLSQEFGLESSRVLTGRKSKTRKASDPGPKAAS